MTRWILGFVLAAFAATSAATTFAQGCDPCPEPVKPAKPPVLTAPQN